LESDIDVPFKRCGLLTSALQQSKYGIRYQVRSRVWPHVLVLP
jgi:hypothetical protein